MTMARHPWPPELLAGALRQIAIQRRIAQIIARGPRACGIPKEIRMTAKHTQGPVYLVSVVEKDHERQTKHVHNIFNRDGLYAHIAECWNADNARRIVAAWNACQGIPTEVLEAQQSGGLPWPAWQPIETAPKDGTVVLARIPDSDVQQAVMWSAKEGCWVIQWDHWKLRGLDAPTHWMRLPEVE